MWSVDEKERISKRQVAKNLRVTERCLYTYLDIANGIFDFEQDYPQFESHIFTRVGLTEYQIWVIQTLVAGVNSGCLIKSQLREFWHGELFIRDEIAQQLTKEKYNQFITKESQENGFNSIVKAA